MSFRDSRMFDVKPVAGAEARTAPYQGYRYDYYGEPYSGHWWDHEGPHRGKGPKGYQRSDERIRDDVSDRLMMDGLLDASRIEVTVQNGEVTLSGHVDARAGKRRAEAIADSVAGVQDVHNRLQVDRARPPGETGEDQAMSRNMPQDLWSERVRPGMIVMSADGDRLGSVASIREGSFHLDREADFDLDIPYSDIKEVNEEFVTLNLRSDELDSSKMGTYPYDEHADVDEAPRPKDIKL
ncbi:MAG: BON domain-containing protein [Rudaea sp.]